MRLRDLPPQLVPSPSWRRAEGGVLLTRQITPHPTNAVTPALVDLPHKGEVLV